MKKGPLSKARSMGVNVDGMLQGMLGKDKGLGDTVERFTKATGIKKIVDTVSKATGKDCGCKGRKDKLNKMFPYIGEVDPKTTLYQWNDHPLDKIKKMRDVKENKNV
jgi:hypothetical protein|tara:strand:- start:473 stop:793 length:321 start_codon:yes stop_codon:yes gene_type:complete